MKKTIKKAYCGFTLAEILITLGIIGVVAALTIPVLFSKIQEQVLVHRLKDTYAILNEAYKLTIVEHDTIEAWDLGEGEDNSAGARKAFNYFKPYLKNIKECGTGASSKEKCFADNYRALFNDNLTLKPNASLAYARGQLANGVSLGFWARAGESPHIAILVDINGDAPPNRAGVDLFQFGVSNIQKAVIPSDSILTANSYDEICRYKSTSTSNGFRCTAWVIAKGNMDYLRRDITNDWKKYKGIE